MDVDRRSRRVAGQGWLSTILGVLVLVAGGFALGLVVGVISEEPELVVGHVAGRTTEIEWSADRAGAEPGVAGSADVRNDWGMPATDVEVDDGRAVGHAVAGNRARSLPSVAAAAAPGTGAKPVRVEAGRAAAPTTSVAPDPDSAATFAIQVGAFQDSNAAQGVAGRLRAGGYPVQVLAPQSDDRWRVRVGPITSRTQADETAQRLKVEENLPTWVLRENSP